MFQGDKVTFECMLGVKRLCYIVAKMLALNMNTVYGRFVSLLNFETIYRNILHEILD
jgi:hypothetical protein